MVLTQGARGEVNVLVGECKTGSRIEPGDVENLGAVAQALEAAGLNAYVLFSKLTNFTAEEIRHISALDRPDRPRVILLTAREIEPTYIYEHMKLDDHDRVPDLTFRGLAEATRLTFFASTRGEAATAADPA